MKQKHYSIHGFLNVALSYSGSAGIISDKSFPLSFFETSSGEENPFSLEVKIGKFNPQNNGCTLVDREFFVKHDYLYCKASERSARFELEINGMESDRTTVNWSSRIVGVQSVLEPFFFPHNHIVRHLLRAKLFRKNALLVHGAALEESGKAIAFFGRGSVGKTSLVMQLNRNGMNYIGDDYFILNERNAFCFPVLFQEYNLRLFHQKTEHLNSAFDSLRWLALMSRKFDKKTQGVPVPEKARVKKAFFVDKSDIEEPIVENVPFKEAIKKISYNDFLEQFFTPLNAGLVINGPLRQFLAYSYCFPQSEIARFWENWRIMLEKNLSHLRFKRIILPMNIDGKTLQKAAELL